MQTPGSSKIVQGRYEIVDEQMRCRFSTLYRAIDQLTRAPVVLRRLHTPLVPAESKELAKDQFMKEGRVLRRLVHRNLPRVLDAVEHEGEFFLVMETFEGQTLDQVAALLPERPTEALLYRWMDQVASALAYLHSQDPPVIYRDLRPQTVIMTPQAVIKLVDFGLARMVEDMSRERTAFRGRGATNYAAPEQFGSSPSNPRMDLYALGATFYFLACGKMPPPAWDRSYSGSTLPEIRKDNPSITPSFEALITKLMALYPKDRPLSAQEVRKEIHALCPDAVEVEEVALDEAPTIRPAQRAEAPAGIRKPGTSEGPAVRMRPPSSATGAPGSATREGATPGTGEEGPRLAGEAVESSALPGRVLAPEHAAPPASRASSFIATPPPPAGPAALPQPVPPMASFPPGGATPEAPAPPPAPDVPVPAGGMSMDTLVPSRLVGTGGEPVPPPLPSPPPSPQDAVPLETIVDSSALRAARDSLLAQLGRMSPPTSTGSEPEAPVPDQPSPLPPPVVQVPVAPVPAAQPWPAEPTEVPFVDILHVAIDRAVARVLPESVARRFRAICIGRQAGRDFIIALVEPHTDVGRQLGLFFGTNPPILVRADERALALAHDYVYRVPASEAQVPWQAWLEAREAFEEEKGPEDRFADARRQAFDIIRRHVWEPLEQAPQVVLDTGDDEVMLGFTVGDMVYVLSLTALPRSQAPLAPAELEGLADAVIVGRVGRQFTRGEAGPGGPQAHVVAEVEVLTVEKTPESRRDPKGVASPPGSGSRFYVHYRKANRETVNRAGPQGQGRELREGQVARLYLRASRGLGSNWHLVEPNGWSSAAAPPTPSD